MYGLNSKFSEPRIPAIEGVDKFQGRVLHTKFYRTAEPFTDQNVVIFGLGPSALDIAKEICGVTQKDVRISFIYLL